MAPDFPFSPGRHMVMVSGASGVAAVAHTLWGGHEVGTSSSIFQHGTRAFFCGAGGDREL